MMHTRSRPSHGRHALAAFAALTLSACASGGQSMREAAGLVAPPPDEFLVVARAPLELPADFSALPTPQPGAPSRVEPDPQGQAQAALLGGEVAVATAAPTEGEAALLAAAGAGPQNAEIRDQIVAERPVPERRFGLDSLFGRRIIQDPDAEDARLSPEEEAERLQREGLPAPAIPAAP